MKDDKESMFLNIGPGSIEYFPQWLTKREWYAGMALQGMISDPERNGSFKDFAEGAFLFADAMIEASKK